MRRYPVIVVSGAPASGKTCLASGLAADLGRVYLSKDQIKENLLDSLGWSDRAFSRAVGKASFQLLLQIASELSSKKVPFILESAFRATDGARLLEALGTDDLLQIFCAADSATLLSRFEKRASSGERHPGHADHCSLAELRESLDTGLYGKLDLPGRLVTIDTTNPDSAAYRDGYSGILRLFA